ncbi:MAG: auxin-responsive promoter, partial [Cyanobacteria bacterium RYN_339]|nr:auxin-responsive promoter [Cyanobacteria bacterium RYN_339]
QALANPVRTQEALLKRIVALYAPTELGRLLHLDRVHDADDFRREVPLTNADFYDPLFQRVHAENPPNAVTTETLAFLARSSRTTRAAKFIPYPHVMIKAFKQFETALAMHQMRETGNYTLLDGRLLITAGSPTVERTASGLTVGFASGIMAALAPKMAAKIVLPSRPVLEMTDWQAKIAATVDEAKNQDVRVMTGIPTWVVPILEHLLERTGKRTAREVWPNLAAYYWSGCPIGVYEPRLRALFGPEVAFREVYSAAEAPVAYQWKLGEPGLVLDVERTYFEFLEADPASPVPGGHRRLTLGEVEVGKAYKLVVSSLGGLCAYRLEDVIEVLALDPPLIRFLGREIEEMNLGGEKLPIRVMRDALAGWPVENFFVAPSEGGKAYQVYVEGPAMDLDAFAREVDGRLQAAHGLYANLRKHDVALGPLVATALAAGSIQRFVGRSRQFGQGKFLHLYDTRDIVDQVLGQEPLS